MDMIKIDLGCNFYLDDSLTQLANDFKENGVDIDKDLLSKIASGEFVVNGLDGIGPLGENHPKKASTIVDEIKSKTDAMLGANAIKHLLDITYTDTNVECIDSIIIPAEVFHECNSTIWYWICQLAARASNRVHRYRRMIELDAPPIIIDNEYRMAYNAINQLNENGYNNSEPLETPDGVIIRSLSDVGYSLSSGWSEKMRAFFDERDARIDAELAAAESGDDNE